MRRALTMLKYVPAVLCGLLVVAWVLSLTAYFGIYYGSGFVVFAKGDVIFVRNVAEWLSIPIPVIVPLPEEFAARPWYGCIATDDTGDALFLPIPVVLTAFLPASIGCFTRFRFPLWSYFAWTTLIAAELAYYLR